MTPISARYIFTSVIILLTFFNSRSQNLIPDPGFEFVNRHTDGADTVYSYTHWHSLLSLKKLSPEGKPIFSIYAPHHQHDKFFDYWKPYEGDSYMFSHYNYLRNLYQTTLISQLTRNQIYKVSFKYRVLSHGFSDEKEEDSINDKLGVMFTTKDMTDSAGIEMMNNLRMIIRPQVPVQSFSADSLGRWLDFIYYFKADKSYRDFIIGNFQKLIESYEIRNIPLSGISYRIDNVSLEPVEETELIRHLMDLQALQEKRLSKKKHRSHF